MDGYSTQSYSALLLEDHSVSASFPSNQAVKFLIQPIFVLTLDWTLVISFSGSEIIIDLNRA